MTPARPGSGGGAGLRVSGRPALQYLTGSADWRDFSCEFEAREDDQETVIVCELRAGGGDVWFDQASLKVIRAP